jgi:hypothetical protein
MDVLWEYPYEFEFNPLLETFTPNAKDHDQPPIYPQFREVLNKRHLRGGVAVPKLCRWP